MLVHIFLMFPGFARAEEAAGGERDEGRGGGEEEGQGGGAPGQGARQGAARAGQAGQEGQVPGAVDI